MFSSVPDFKAWFPDLDGFPRPDWKAIRDWIRTNVTTDRFDDAWQGITREWLQRLSERLGKSYSVIESQNFHLLSELEPKQQQDLLSFLERTRAHILRQLGDIPLPNYHGKHVVLRFSEEDNYYRYISYFDNEGEHSRSRGRFLSDGYMHIAYPSSSDRGILAHELTHNLLKGFALPSWLDEALAMAFEGDFRGSRGQLRSTTPDEHQTYWNNDTIQEFWSGISFHKLEARELACDLAQVILNLIATDWKPTRAQFRGFVVNAESKDAGQAAALEFLGIDLGDLVATFLGPGEWAPKTQTC